MKNNLWTRSATDIKAPKTWRSQRQVLNLVALAAAPAFSHWVAPWISMAEEFPTLVTFSWTAFVHKPLSNQGKMRYFGEIGSQIILIVYVLEYYTIITL